MAIRSTTATTNATTNSATAPRSVVGLEHGRKRARRRAGARRAKNSVVSVALFLVIGGGVAFAGYQLWQFYGDTQDDTTIEDGVLPANQSTEEIIDHLESQPRWNGPGNPAFGVGGEP